MRPRFQRADTKICLATKFDLVGEHTLQFAIRYCIRTGANLHLIHMCEPSITEVLDLRHDSTFSEPSYDYAKAANESRQRSASVKMRELVSRIPGTVHVTTCILDAERSCAEMINAEALANDCSLIMIGAVADSHRFVPHALSCALSLMSHASLPVMVVKPNHNIDLNTKPLRIVIADDLCTRNESVIKSGCDLAFMLGSTDIYHIHINDATSEWLAYKLRKISSSIKAKSGARLELKDIEHLIQINLQQRLDTRAREMNIPLRLAGCSYNKQILSDASFSDCLKSFVRKKEINLAVFGRHEILHTDPLHIGRIPFYAMLDLACPIIVFPPNANTKVKTSGPVSIRKEIKGELDNVL